VNEDSSAICVFDIASKGVSLLPGSQGYFAPRWSPDGRYIAALTLHGRSIVLFDFQTRKWSELTEAPVAFPNWSADGEYVYFLRRLPQNPAVLRIRISDRKLEQVADLKGIPTAGYFGVFLTLTPDDSPLLRNIGTQDIYSLDFEAP
jgi:Tol biopolymer transport system component